ncbi:hypothetical protein [Polyangium jinanense]|uniref:Lipoprotein n=1 Tax=Polyangium jinanense TaxID=2829994 RepID=A0A9X4AR89_9BACT|nr:hypothetical protein [Polyangium jinanense]MDC3954200.1 hypothetical protein [Polyangium jinanense]MDC3981844.1 hypothetical protein [Polyangium jinanense]
MRTSTRSGFWLLCLPLVACGGAANSEVFGVDPPAEDDEAQPPQILANRFLLALPGPEVTEEITLELDKSKALEMFGEEAARRIRILDVDSTALLGHVLDSIRDACGTGWRIDRKNPGYDCAQTALGRTFGPMWRTSAEFGLVRLLGMTPANTELSGTSLETFAALVEQNPGTFRFDFPQVLAESLGIGRTDPVVPTDALVRALQENLLGTHPGIDNSAGTLPVTLYDALKDLSTLPEKFGPVPGAHPGVLVPDDAFFATRSDVLGPDFRMRVVAESHLRRVRGVDLSSGGGDMFVMEGSTPLSFDFEDPERLVIQGVADVPTVDMRFATVEADPFIPSCEADPRCRPFFLESIVTSGARRAYGRRSYDRCYVELNGECLVGVEIGQGGAPPGWITFANAIRGVTVPEPRFLWDLLAEVAQISLHDPTGDGTPDIPEGAARPVFALQNVPIGPSGAELVRAMRPTLQSQADLMANVIVGRFWENNHDLDFYVRRGAEGGLPLLYFVAPSDRKPDPAGFDRPKPYAYERPGFFTSPDLAEGSRISRRQIPGVLDTEHEKVPLSPGELVLYAQDDTRDVYEIRILVPEEEGRDMVVDFEKVASRRSR